MTSRKARTWEITLAVAAGLSSVAKGQFIGTNVSGTDGGNGTTFSPWEPPDTHGAIGPNHFVEFINGAFAVYNKAGTLIGSRTDENTFWVTASTNAGSTFNPGEPNISDPRVFYDQLSRRWFAIEIDFNNNVMIARTDTNDPTGTWKAVRFSAGAGASNFPDYPTLGFDANGLYIGADMNGSSGVISLWSIPKADVLASTPSVANRSSFTSRATSATVTNPQPIIDFTPGKATPELILGTSGYSPSSSTNLRRVTISGGGAPGATLSAGANVTVPAYTIAPNGRQPGTTAVLDSIDSRFQSSIYQIGSNVWAVHAVNVGGFSNLRWYKIDATTNTVLLSGTISDGSFDLIAPSIAANANDQVVIGATRSGSTAGSGLAGSYAFVGTPGAGTENFTASMQLKAGLAVYNQGGTLQRWGDYSATTVDPADPSIFWTIQEFAKASTAWQTQISEVIVPMANEFRWKNPASDNYTTAAAWLTGSAPVGTSHAIFSRATPAGAYTVTINSNQTNDRLSVRQGSVVFSNTASYTLTNTSLTTPSFVLGEFEATPVLTLSGSGSLDTVNSFIAPNSVSNASLVLQNTHAWNNSGDLYVGGSNGAAGGPATITMNNTPNLNVGKRLKVWGNATINYNGGSFTAGSLEIASGGKVLLSTGGNKAVRVGIPMSILPSGSISISGTGKVDLTDNSMIVDYTSTSQLATVRALLVQAYNGATWTGNGITSSTAAANAGAANKTALGFAEASDLFPAIAFPAVFRGNTVNDNTAVIVAYALYGDANLDKVVDTVDFNILAQNFSSPVDRWSKGDFNYDGFVDTTDFNLLASNFAQFLPASIDALGAVIPEPSALGLGLAGMTIMLRQRRRHS
jgi:hypothetical protein